MKYIVNENCVGCGLCCSVCPEVFSMGDDGFAKASDEEVPEEWLSDANEAMEGCPVSAIEENV